MAKLKISLSGAKLNISKQIKSKKMTIYTQNVCL